MINEKNDEEIAQYNFFFQDVKAELNVTPSLDDNLVLNTYLKRLQLGTAKEIPSQIHLMFDFLSTEKYALFNDKVLELKIADQNFYLDCLSENRLCEFHFAKEVNNFNEGLAFNAKLYGSDGDHYHVGIPFKKSIYSNIAARFITDQEYQTIPLQPVKRDDELILINCQKNDCRIL